MREGLTPKHPRATVTAKRCSLHPEFPRCRDGLATYLKLLQKRIRPGALDPPVLMYTSVMSDLQSNKAIRSGDPRVRNIVHVGDESVSFTGRFNAQAHVKKRKGGDDGDCKVYGSIITTRGSIMSRIVFQSQL